MLEYGLIGPSRAVKAYMNVSSSALFVISVVNSGNCVSNIILDILPQCLDLCHNENLILPLPFSLSVHKYTYKRKALGLFGYVNTVFN